MSEQNNISHLLDDFTLGAPISEHHGVICRPAIRENTNKKYIVKTISVPATQAQFDALLLAGAYKDPGDAMEYFRRNGEDILNEAELLKKLSKLEGFLPYDVWQMEPITRRRLGYEISLAGSYKRSLEKFMVRNVFTHLEAVNLGLDLCAALAVCRQSGYLYADLKPSNVFVSEKKEFRIGDLGFLSLDSMRYASLPERYFSPYTPPELLDPMAAMNLTVDTYALGMILYQLYNDGHLPFKGVAPLESLPAPLHADYEMAEIIMKAIHPDPEQRWTDPKDLGKAIASYMQRNSVNDIPITPFIPLDVVPEDVVMSTSTTDTDPADEIVHNEQPEEPECAEEMAQTVAAEEPQAEESQAEESDSRDAESLEETVLSQEELPETEYPDADNLTDSDEFTSSADSSGSPDESETEPSQEPDVSDDIAQPENIPEVKRTNDMVALEEVSEEVAKIISKADDIIAHEIPAESVFPTEESKPDPFSFVLEDSDSFEDDYPEEPLMEEIPKDRNKDKKKKTKHFADNSGKKKFRKFLLRVLSLLILSGLSLAGYWYYQNIYLQPIDSLSISGTQNQITVLVDTVIEESMLSVHCISEDGKRHSESIDGGKAVFSGLKPSTQYTIQLDISGFHKLEGTTSDVFRTAATTQILTFDTVAGSEHGSVMLDFTVDGEEPNFWNIRYQTEGEDEKLETITNHSTMITGLTVGKVYTFTLDGGKDFDVGGMTSVSYLASRLVLAEDITVTSDDGTDVAVTWKTPGDVVVESWDVRCYDGYGFEEVVTVTENMVQFTGIDPSTSYTVEITAAGMTEPARVSITADSINVTEFLVDESSKTELKVAWDYTGTDPEGGWLLLYTVDGSGSQIISCEKPSAVISPLIPGANYKFVLQTADTRTVFNNTLQHTAGAAENFTQYKFITENITFNLLETPDDPEWNYETIGEGVFTTTFRTGDSASMVMNSTTDLYVSGYKTTGLFVIRDSFGNVLPELVTEVIFTWKDIWMSGDIKTAEMDIPLLPTLPGDYSLEIFFDGCFVATFDITITG